MGKRIPLGEIFPPMNSLYFIDTNLIMYTLGSDHLFKEPSRKILEKIKAGDIYMVTDKEVLQEILYRYFSLKKPAVAETAYTSLIKLCLKVFAISNSETDKALQLMKTFTINSRHAIHVASMLNNGIKNIISTDAHFDLIPEIKRIDPREMV